MRDDELAALLRGARRLRPPHGERQRLHARRGAGHPAQHLRVPHAVPRLVRHRLQLPRRPVRPDLGGPVRRRRPPGRRRAHPRTTTTTRSRCRRSATSSIAQPLERDAPGVRRAVRLEALAARRRRVLDQAVGRLEGLPGDQRPPRRRGRPPARASTSTPRSRRSGRLAAEAQRGWAGRELESNLAGSPHPDLVVRRASDGQGFIIPTGGLTGFGPGVAALTGLDAGATAVAVARPHRRRHRRPPGPRGRTATAAVRPGNGDGTFGAADQADRRVRRARPGHRRRRPQRRRPQRPGRPADRRPAGSTSSSAAATAGSASSGSAPAGATTPAGRRRRRRTATARPTCWPATRPARCGCTPAPARAGFAHRRRGARRLEAATPRSPASATSPATAAPTCSPRERSRQYGFVLPANGDGSYGHPLGPVARLTSVGGLLGAAQRPRRRHPGPGGPHRRRGSWCSRTAAPSRPAGRSPTGVDLSRRQPGAQRRRLGPRRLRRRDHPEHEDRRARAPARRRHRPVRARRSKLAERLRQRRPARRGRRHDRRRLPGPDGPAGAAARSGSTRAAGSTGSARATSRTAAIEAGRADRGRPLGRRRRAGLAVPQGREADAVPRQRPGRADRPEGRWAST